MQFESYESYVNHSKEYYKDREMNVPVENLILSEATFNTFNGNIDFGAGSPSKSCGSNCKCFEE